MDEVANKRPPMKAGSGQSASPSTVPLKRGSNLANLIDQGAQFDAIFIDPRRIVRMLGEFYADGSATLDRCMPLHFVMAATSVAVIATRMKDIAVVQTRLLPRCGFSQVKFVQPRLRPPGTPHWSAEVILVAGRGGARLADYHENELAELAINVGPLEFAECIYPEGRRRLHAFATSYRPGWTTLFEGNTWIEVPTL